VQIEYSGPLGLFPIALSWVIFGYFWNHENRLNFVPDITTAKRWVPATSIEVAKLLKKLDAIKQFDGGCSGTIIKGILAILIFLVAVVGVSVMTDDLPGYASSDLVGITFVDVLIVLAATFSVFKPSFWTPPLIEFKLPVFEKLLSKLPEERMGSWSREYQFELSKTSKGEVPVDIRWVLKPPDCPKDFLGIQSQIAINRGGPYVYFVVIARSALPIKRPKTPDGNSSFWKSLFSGTPDVVDAKIDKEVNILVIRQHADKKSGYITNINDQIRLLRTARDSTLETIRV